VGEKTIKGIQQKADKNKQPKTPSSGGAAHIATLKKRMIVAMEKHLCIIAHAALAAGVDRRTHYRWMQTDPEYNAKINALAEIPLDMAENSLLEQIREKNTAATIYYLKCKGKKRGYIEKQEFDTEQVTGRLTEILERMADQMGVK